MTAYGLLNHEGSGRETDFASPDICGRVEQLAHIERSVGCGLICNLTRRGRDRLTRGTRSDV
jgi:hypothetical protein